jgi:hypothetical protein
MISCRYYYFRFAIRFRFRCADAFFHRAAARFQPQATAAAGCQRFHRCPRCCCRRYRCFRRAVFGSATPLPILPLSGYAVTPAFSIFGLFDIFRLFRRFSGFFAIFLRRFLFFAFHYDAAAIFHCRLPPAFIISMIIAISIIDDLLRQPFLRFDFHYCFRFSLVAAAAFFFRHFAMLAIHALFSLSSILLRFHYCCQIFAISPLRHAIFIIAGYASFRCRHAFILRFLRLILLMIFFRFHCHFHDAFAAAIIFDISFRLSLIIIFRLRFRHYFRY